VRLARGDDLIDKRIDSRATAIDDALPEILMTFASGKIRKSAAASAFA
jgi:hypothetical protein